MKHLAILICLIPFLSQGQDMQGLLLNSKETDPLKYQDVKGNPYYFDGFVKGRIISNSAETLTDLTLNYNAESQEFELVRNGKTIQLDKTRFMRVEVHPDDNPDLSLEFPIIFQRGFNMKWLKKFGVMLYDGTKIKLVKDYTTEISINVVQDVGKTLEHKRIATLEEYFFLVEGELTTIKLKKKRILKELEHSSELEKYIKEATLDIESEAGLRKLLAHYETLN